MDMTWQSRHYKSILDIQNLQVYWIMHFFKDDLGTLLKKISQNTTLDGSITSSPVNNTRKKKVQ